jgi:hypothetical protein
MNADRQAMLAAFYDNITHTINQAARNDLYRTIIERIIWRKAGDDTKVSIKFFKRRCVSQLPRSRKGGDPVDNQTKIPNRLIKEKSPYLLQHAYNPVDWYPWGEEAFEKARHENKPVFLSIGYS